MIEQRIPDHPIARQILSSLASLAETGKSVALCWCPSHVGIPGNEMADRRARQRVHPAAVNERVPFTDLLPTLQGHFRMQWQHYWNQQTHDKLFQVKLQVKPWTSAARRSRREEIAFARLRLGHTRVTHGNLMRGDPLRRCNRCQVEYSIEHIFIECPNFNTARQKFFGNIPTLNLYTVLAENPYHDSAKIFAF